MWGLGFRVGGRIGTRIGVGVKIRIRIGFGVGAGARTGARTVYGVWVLVILFDRFFFLVSLIFSLISCGPATAF